MNEQFEQKCKFFYRCTARIMSRVRALYNVQSVVRHSKYDVQIKMAEDETVLSSNDEVKKACLLRNQNEKRRRDRFNNLVSELSVALPVTGKKLSRNNVLKYAIEHFRQAKQLATSSAELNSRKLYGRWQPDFITSEEFRQTIFDGLSGIVMAVSETSKIFYVSSNAFSCLGYDCDQLLNNSILDLVHPEEQRMMYSLLTSIRRNSADSSHNPPQLFTCRFRCGPQQSHRSNNSFEAFRCVGRSFRGVDHTEGNDCCLVLLGRAAFFPTVNHAVVLSDTETVSKFTTRLNKLWRFECVERSTTLVLGYYPFELLGACFYEYCHDEDLANLTEYHNMLPYSGVITTCCYRLLTKGQVWIWVRSRCHVSYSQLNSKPDSVICVTWPMKGSEFNMFNQEEVLERDRRLFSQILEKNGEIKPEKNGEKQHISSSGAQNAVSSSSLSLSTQDTQKTAEQSHMTSSVKVITVNPGVQSHTMNDNSDFLSTIPDQCSQGLAGSQSVSAMWSSDTHVDSAAMLMQRDGHYILNGSVDPPMENVDVNSLLLEDYVEMPESLSLSQWAMHLHLRDKYKNLTESIRQQSEQISVIQRQLAIQKELSELSDELEVQEKLKKRNLHNTVEETRAIIHQKMRELQDCTVAS